MAQRSVIVIGGGILGLAIAERLSRTGIAVTLLEKEPGWAAHQTGHNSGVVHAGPYYLAGSLKARLCTAGNESMARFALDNGIPYERCGKLIVAVAQKEVVRLDALYERAMANGVVTRVLSAEETLEFEPHVRAVKALRVEATGIIDYVGVSRVLARKAAENGARLLLGARAESIRVDGNGVTVAHADGSVRAGLLINCAGLHADRIATLAGVTPEVRVVPFRGEYYELMPAQRALVKGLIYPVPDPALPFLGVHLTRMIDGSVHAGPNAVLALSREGYDWRTINLRDSIEAISYPGFLRMAGHNIGTGIGEVARSFSQRLFARSLARLVPEIGCGDIVRAGAGVRAQAVRQNGALADDFVIQRGPKQIHVLNAPSPAATSSLEIARHIAAIVDDVDY